MERKEEVESNDGKMARYRELKTSGIGLSRRGKKGGCERKFKITLRKKNVGFTTPGIRGGLRFLVIKSSSTREKRKKHGKISKLKNR